MKFEATAPTGRDLGEVAELRLYELYHANTKLTAATAYRTSSQSELLSGAERHLMTRGFRQYRRSASVVLPPALPARARLEEVLASRRSDREFGRPIEFAELATLLELSLGCTAIVEDAETDLIHALRAWPSAGGLYPIDTYVAAAAVSGLEPAFYHYNPIRNDLEQLPSREVGAIVRDGFFDQDFPNAAAAALLFVACFERTVGKYGERGYRLALLDAGHAAQNVLLCATQLGIRAVPMAGYSDDSLAADLGVDGISEAVVHSILLGRSPDD